MWNPLFPSWERYRGDYQSPMTFPSSEYQQQTNKPLQLNTGHSCEIHPPSQPTMTSLPTGFLGRSLTGRKPLVRSNVLPLYLGPLYCQPSPLFMGSPSPPPSPSQSLLKMEPTTLVIPGTPYPSTPCRLMPTQASQFTHSPPLLRQKRKRTTLDGDLPTPLRPPPLPDGGLPRGEGPSGRPPSPD